MAGRGFDARDLDRNVGNDTRTRTRISAHKLGTRTRGGTGYSWNAADAVAPYASGALDGEYVEGRRAMARYDAFLLRIWRTGEGNAARWAIRLEHLPDGQGARLDSLEALVAHLVAVLPVPGIVAGHEEKADAPPAAGTELMGG